ncbi:MAG: CoA pyrophosphatase, partial [Candidatus Puniceispirillum sp.]
LREAFEEIGLLPERVRVAGGLNPVRSPAGFVVQPVVGIVDEAFGLQSLTANPDEVDLIFTLSLAHIANPDNFRLVPRHTAGRRNDYWVVTHSDHHIWGLSARVLNDFHQRLDRIANP